MHSKQTTAERIKTNAEKLCFVSLFSFVSTSGEHNGRMYYNETGVSLKLSGNMFFFKMYDIMDSALIVEGRLPKNTDAMKQPGRRKGGRP